MKPIDPDPGKRTGGESVTYGAGQRHYLPLPAAKFPENGQVVTRWQLSDEERAAIAAGGDVWLSILTFDRPLQPVRLGVRGADVRTGWPDGD
jgi:hypothetical protein